jgi:hypothetical protein
MLITVPSTGGSKRKPYSALVLKNHKKISETRQLESFQHLLKRKMREENQTKLESEKT